MSEDTQKAKVKVQVLPYMGKPKDKDKKSPKYPAITSGTYTKQPRIQKERDDYER